MTEGRIIKSISGFFYVETEGQLIECKARGNVRKAASEPLVGDRVELSVSGNGKGTLERIFPRRNSFIRPAVANIDILVIFASNVIPVTDPFLIDRVTAIAANKAVECVICINKQDLETEDSLTPIYRHAGFRTIHTSALTGQGIAELKAAITGKTVVFTGNSGVGKSSVLNRLAPGLNLKTGEVSDKLGRGKHTTRHIELFPLDTDTFVADTPGFSSFDTERMDLINKNCLAEMFPDFEPYRRNCRYSDCAHMKEPGCRIRSAVESGDLEVTRYESYKRLYEHAAELNFWELK